MNDKISINLNRASVHFKVNLDGGSLKTKLTRKFEGTENHRYIKALDEVTLNITEGERVGIVGLNGAGKSTILKLMAGIYPPTSGTVEISGHVCPMFEFATGFEMHQTGWDNIKIRALL
ncbi:MAG: ATP-binding cassette domain-containing protein, partial [Erysipelotrichia bacterium]|nr:ATP-binding cassette domain-containing protein [Erysipelotrichia bacterium]